MIARLVIEIIGALLRGLFVRQRDEIGRRLQVFGRGLLVLCALLGALAYVYYDHHGFLLFSAAVALMGACLAGGGAALRTARIERPPVNSSTDH